MLVSHPGRLTPGKRVTDNLCISGWVGSRPSGLDALEKRNIQWSCWESNKDTSVVKPVAYTPLVYVNDKHPTGDISEVVTDRMC